MSLVTRTALVRNVATMARGISAAAAPVATREITAAAPRALTANDYRPLYLASSYDRGAMENSIAAAVRDQVPLDRISSWLTKEYPGSLVPVAGGPQPVLLSNLTGDPNVSLLSKIGGAIARTAVGFATGGPAGAVMGAASGLLGGGSKPPTPPTFAAAGLAGGLGGAIGRIGGAIGRVAGSSIGRTAIGGVATGAGIGIINRMTSGSSALADALPRGYHYNKVLRRYEIAKANGRDVQDPRDEPRVKNEVVRNRSMNVLNPRALARANRRVCGFAGVARKTLRDLGYQVSSSRKARSCGSKKKKCR